MFELVQTGFNLAVTSYEQEEGSKGKEVGRDGKGGRREVLGRNMHRWKKTSIRTIRNTLYDRHMVIFSPIRYLYTSSKLRTVSLIQSIYYFIGYSLPNSMLSGRRSRCIQLLIQHFTKSGMPLVTYVRGLVVIKYCFMWTINSIDLICAVDIMLFER